MTAAQIEPVSNPRPKPNTNRANGFFVIRYTSNPMKITNKAK